MYEKALDILNQISSLGYEAYIIGGYPRDKYLGITNYDIDICTNIPIKILKKKFNVVTQNLKFNSIVINDEYNFDITNFRKDYYENNRYPKVKLVNTLIEDLERRDFIINTLCIDKDGNYVDLLNAREDLDNRIIKTIGLANKSLKEDPLRILRAIRFSLILNFKIDSNLEKAIYENKHLLNDLSDSLIEKEINKMLEKSDYESVKEIINKYDLEVEICKKN